MFPGHGHTPLCQDPRSKMYMYKQEFKAPCQWVLWGSHPEYHTYKLMEKMMEKM